MYGLDFNTHELHDTLITLLQDGPQPLEWLARRARQVRRDARIDEDVVRDVVHSSSLLVGAPDEHVGLLIDHLDGQVLTHRVTAPTAGRTDLWSNLALQPLAVCAIHFPLRLAAGGELRAAAFGHEALVGPPGWLPDVQAGTLLALSVSGRQVAVQPLPQGTDASPQEEQAVRAALGRHYRRELWEIHDQMGERPAELNRAIGHALLENPQLLAKPVSPLNELLYDALEQDRQDHVFLQGSRWAGDESISFHIHDMPASLYSELAQRAGRYGMSFDHYVVAVLGLAAWRTPFAEDLGPWDDWDVDTTSAAGDSDDDPGGAVLRVLP
jgi:hypothetical protein